MRLRALVIGAAAAMLLTVPQIAQAAWGQATGNVNMRTCPSTQCPKITVVPVGAPVWIAGTQGGWYFVTYGGRQGYVSGRYIASVGAQPRVVQPFFRPLPPPYGYNTNPWWDPRYGAWFDGRRWYYQGRWYSQPPSGFYFGFRFGG